LYAGGTFTSIDDPTAVCNTFAAGINDAGEIAGSNIIGGTYHGYVDVGGSFTSLDYPGALQTQARGINNSGEIVGAFLNPSPVPEPDCLFLAAIGLAVLMAKNRFYGRSVLSVFHTA
jgi:uncharacterized membrane protein